MRTSLHSKYMTQLSARPAFNKLGGKGLLHMQLLVMAQIVAKIVSQICDDATYRI